MENSNLSRNNSHGEHLGVNKMGKNIKKSPLHQPNFTNTKQPSQPQVYNISKNDFRSIVQQLTGSPSQDPLPRPPENPPKSPSMRLQKIRPPPLTPINRHQISSSATPLFNNNFVRPVLIGQPSMSPVPSLPQGNQAWPNTAESPISAYMRYLQKSIIDSGPRPTQPPRQIQPMPSSGLLPTPPPPTHAFPSPHENAPALLPSPTSQFLLPSPSSFLNLLSPQSPYPLISPSFQYSSPQFAYSPISQSGILGPGPQPPLSPGYFFPSSPTEFFPISSPRWRNQ
ncbi:protein HAIKU1-like isoform X1 [Telopea speciosissima]|uniref:protein HAIKU1-like isoform X1 n=1 Tax=Telopea speciosissima TaxID=54955 RepID=UPI001CC7B956|nr:protein HAIKU1-like isoform X1 [Telopea speciosissima]